ncbi:hypothetical protein, conserved [Plasmodium gonderi]|uniref:Uncharacterized protein n=1 Tax=Plasmodium gonderi TaxID=77519 RepID=A0A1Y1JCD6_PLAGO|nr:hypothetical protein, conserved [Plasmodium gonderi]GAW80191.1 hypothetical protein, conserved [Plasmodium gonderi]
MGPNSQLAKTVMKFLMTNNGTICTKADVRKHFSVSKLPESLKGLYEKKLEQMELRKKKLEEKKKKMDKVQISRERKNKFKSSKGQHNVF